MKETEPILPDEAALGKMTAEERRGFFGRLLRLLGLAGDAEKSTAGAGNTANAVANAAARNNAGETAGNGAVANGAAPAANAGNTDAGNANAGSTNAGNANTESTNAAPGSEAALSDAEALEVLGADPRFPDFDARLAEIKTILRAIPALAAVAPRGRYLLGYFAARGLADYRDQKKEKSAAALVDALCAREDAVKLYETKRIAALDASAAAYPRHAGGFSTASVPATPKKTPRNLDEACAAALGLFGLAR